MSIIGPVRRPVAPPVVQPVGVVGLPWGQGGGGAGFLPPTISISGTVTIGGTLTATLGGGPTTSLTLYRGAVSAGVITSPYTYVAADCLGASLTVVATGPAGSATSNALVFSLLNLSSLLAAIDLNVSAPTPGTDIATCPAVLGSSASVAGTTRTFSLTNLVASDGTTHPGFQLVSARMAWPIGALLTGLTKAWVIIGYRDYLDTSTHDKVLLELGTPNFLGDGRFAAGRNGGTGAGSFSALAQGGGGVGVWVSTDYQVPEWPGVIAILFDMTAAAGSTAWRVDNVAGGGAVSSANVVAGSTFDASQSLYIGGRDGGAADVPLLLNTMILLNGAASEADVTTAIRYAANKMGEVAA